MEDSILLIDNSGHLFYRLPPLISPTENSICLILWVEVVLYKTFFGSKSDFKMVNNGSFSFPLWPFSLHIFINNPFFITCGRSFKQRIVLLHLSRHSKMEMRLIKYFLFNRAASRYRNDPRIQVGFKCLSTVPMRYVQCLCDLLCYVTWIIFNKLFYLFIVSGCKSAGMFSDFQIKISTSEALMNNILSYGTFFINCTYLFCCLFSLKSRVPIQENNYLSGNFYARCFL